MTRLQTPRAVDTTNRGPAILIVSWIECTVAIFIVGARMFTRARLVKNIGIDDWLILLALLLAINCTSFVTAAVSYGAGRHYDTLDPRGKLMAVKLTWISHPFHIFSCGVGKISVALLLLRIMARNKFLQWCLYTLITLLVIINAICVGFIFGQCSPVRKLWEPAIDGNCLNPRVQQDVGFFQSSFSSFTDFVLAMFPLIIIWNLQMKRAVKFGLGCAMSLGLFATGAAIVKTIQLQDLTARSDYTYDTVDLVIWLTTEMYTVVVAACVPTLRPLLPLLHCTLPRRERDPRKGESYLSQTRRRIQGYHAQEDIEGHGMHILQPPKSYGQPRRPGDYQIEIKRGGNPRRDADVESEELILPKPDANNIMKTTEVDVSIHNDPSPDDITCGTSGNHQSVRVADKDGFAI